MRTLALLATLAVAALAMTATTALGATEVRDADTGQLCPAVVPALDQTNAADHMLSENTTYTSGGCTVEMVGQSGQAPEATTIYTHYGPIDCGISYTLHVGPDGWGYANNFSVHGSGLDEYECAALEPCPSGVKIVTPPDYDPFAHLAQYGWKWYPAADSDTDLNLDLCLRRDHGAWTNDYYGMASLDVDESSPANFALVNQATDPTYHFGMGGLNFMLGGEWTSANNAPGLTITHN